MGRGGRDKRKDHDVHKLVVFGAQDVGKTTMTVVFVTGHFMTGHDPTVEDNYCRDIEIDNEKVRLDILDTADDEYSAQRREEYVREAKGFMIVYAIFDRASFEQVEVFHRDLLQAKGSADFPVVICGNQCDLEEQRVVSKAEGEELAERLKAKFFETSALTGLHIEDAFLTVVREGRQSSASASRASDEKKRGKECVLL